MSKSLILLLISVFEKARLFIFIFLVPLNFFSYFTIETSLYFLTLLKLARFQITSWGHPETTGNNKIDFFLSSKLLETNEYQNNYSEKVLLSNYLPMYFYKPKLSFS